MTFPLVRKTASWFLVSMYLIWIFGSIEQPIKRNSVGPENMSHCGTPSLDDHFDHCFVDVTRIRTDTTQQGAQAQGEQTESN